MKLIRYVSMLLLSGVLFSCDDEGIQPPAEPERPSATVTYLLYMVGQNDLASFLTKNINDLKTGYKNSDINANILVYADISKAPELYLIEKDKNGEVTKTTVRTYSDRYSVDPEVMKEVINEVFQEYPSDYRAVTFSSHANGSLYTDQIVCKRSFGYEGSAGYGMNVTDIREALDGCPKMDLITFDACMMGNVETAYELRNNTRYFLSSPNSVPAEGFPYAKALPYILKMNEEGFIKTAQAYMKYFQTNADKWDDFVSVSLTDVTKMDSLVIYMDSLLQDEDVQERLPFIKRGGLQRVEDGYALYDYGNWVDNIGEDCKYLPKVKEQLDKVVVYKEHGDYLSVDDWGYNLIIPVTDETFCGLNTYVPPAMNYNQEVAQRFFFTKLAWYRDAGLWRSSYYNAFDGSF